MEKRGEPQWPPAGLPLSCCAAGCPPGLLPTSRDRGPVQHEVATGLLLLLIFLRPRILPTYSSTTHSLSRAGVREQHQARARPGQVAGDPLPSAWTESPETSAWLEPASG